MKRTLLLLGLLASLALGCDKGSTSSTPAKQSRPYAIAVIPKGTTHVFWQSVHAGANRAAKDLGVEIKWQGPQGEAERGQQIQIVNDLLTQGVNAVCLAPIDSNALVETINETSRQVPVVIFDSGANTENYTAYVATDNRKGGQLAGEEMLRLLGDAGGEIAIVRVMAGSQSTTEREEGFKEVVAKNPKIKIVAEQYGDSDKAKSQRVAGDILAAHPNLVAFYGPNESSTVGILNALKDVKKNGKLKFVGFDSSEELAKALDDGEIDALVLQNPVLMGDHAVRAAVAKLKGENVEKNQPIEPTLITRANKDQPAMQQLLRPNLEADLK
ncbi:MAG TPA: substrate-binding domain-containing protein [Tepidisphaeraceae bacterium]|nr:substrate-binding domain-containing protein [Tepidisphaeraceae bacterium]